MGRGTKRSLADFPVQAARVAPVTKRMLAYFIDRSVMGADASSAEEKLLQYFITSPATNKKGNLTKAAITFNHDVSNNKAANKTTKKHLRLRVKYFCGDVQAQTAYSEFNADRGACIMDINLYTCHLTASIQHTTIDATLDKATGIADPVSGEFQKGSKKTALLLLKQLLLKVKGYNSMIMNGRDYRNLTNSLAKDEIRKDGLSVFSYTAQQLLHVTSLLGWLVNHNTRGDVSPGILSMSIAVAHCLRALSFAVDPLIYGKKKDHYHIFNDHFVAILLATLSPWILFCEGAFEAHLRALEKKYIKMTSRKIAQQATTVQTIAHLHAILQGAYLDVSSRSLASSLITAIIHMLLISSLFRV